MTAVTVSGSFHRHMTAIYEAVSELRALGANVLSPSDPRVVDHIGEFLFVASDNLRSIKLVQDRHFAAIKSSDFLWVVCPDAYTGASTCLEIGAAYHSGTPVYSATTPSDITVREYVQVVDSLVEAMHLCELKTKKTTGHVYPTLIDPAKSIDLVVASLEELRPALLGRGQDVSKDPERKLMWTKRLVLDTFGA